MQIGFEGTLSIRLVIQSPEDLATCQQAYDLLSGITIEESKPHARKRTASGNDKVIDLLKHDFGTASSFTTQEANAAVKKELRLGRSTVRNSLGAAIKGHVIRRVGKGVFAFASGTVQSTGIIDIQGDHVSGIVEAFAMAEKVSPALYLLLDKDGIACRVNDEKSSALVDIHLSKRLFTHYKVDKPVSVAIDGKALVDRLKKLKRFSLVLDSIDSQLLKIGGFDLRVAHIEEAKKRLEPLETKSRKGQITIDRHELEGVLQEAGLNASHMDIIYSTDNAVLSNVSDSGDNWSTEIKSGYEAGEPGRTRYVVASLLRALKHVDCKSVTLRDNGEFLSIQFGLGQGILAQHLVGAMSIAPKLGS